jgi:hypothetical protein
MPHRNRLGLIGTGQGPRQEYIDFHGGLLRELGADVKVVMRHALDGLSAKAIAALAPTPNEPAIHGYVRSENEHNRRFGTSWGDAWISRSHSVRLVQECIDVLEQEEQVDAIIYCCGEPYPEGAFRSSKPLILPYQVVLSYVVGRFHAHPGRVTVGILTSGTRQRAQQLAMWRAQEWASRVDLQFEVFGDAPYDAADRLAAAKPELVLYWGYGTGLAPGDDPGLISGLEKTLAQPIVLPHIVSTLFVRNYLYPSINGRQYVQETTEQVAHEAV